MDGDPPAIETIALEKRYAGAERPALAGLDLTVPAGTIRGLLGPNGAGKTTAVRVLATLLRPTGGRARVAGYDVAGHPVQVRRRIGLVGQFAAVDEVLTGRQNLALFGRLNHLGRRAAARAEELLERFDLTAAADQRVAEYSGGMRRRLDLAASLLAAPEVLFVDEPTTGLDPAGRREVWSALRELARDGATVLLTTQYLEEADLLADGITMLRAGRVVLEGTPGELKAAAGHSWIDIELKPGGDVGAVQRLAERIGVPGTTEVDAERRRVSTAVADRTGALVEAAIALRDAGVEPIDISLRQPTLDEVFLQVMADSERREGQVPA